MNHHLHILTLSAFTLAWMTGPASSQAQTTSLDQPAPLQTEATLAAATQKARSENRLVLLEFMMNSCSHCQEFKKNVLDSPKFHEFAAQHLAVVIYDVVDLKSLPEAEQKVEQEMQAKFHVENVPTILVFSPAGKQLLRSEGYGGGSAETVVANLLPLLQKEATGSVLQQ